MTGYFSTVGTPLISGREFAPSDTAEAPKVAVVNEAFARQFLPNKNPLGFHLGRTGADAKLDIQIVGIVKDAKYNSMKTAPPALFFTPIVQGTRGWNRVYFYLRTSIDPEQIAMTIRREVAALDPNLPIREIKTMQTQLDENTFNERTLSVLTASFAGLATILAAVGLYGVLAFNVARRTREIGLRMALGANAPQVRRLVVRELLLMLVIGTVIGLGGAAASGKVVEGFLFEMKHWDFAVYVGAAMGYRSGGSIYPRAPGDKHRSDGRFGV